MNLSFSAPSNPVNAADAQAHGHSGLSGWGRTKPKFENHG